MSGRIEIYEATVTLTGGFWRKHENEDGEQCDGYLEVKMPYSKIRTVLQALDVKPITASCVKCGKEYEMTKQEIADSLEYVAGDLRDAARDLHHYARGLYVEDAKETLTELVKNARAQDDEETKEWMFSEYNLGRVIEDATRNVGDTYERQYGNLG